MSKVANTGGYAAIFKLALTESGHPEIRLPSNMRMQLLYLYSFFKNYDKNTKGQDPVQQLLVPSYILYTGKILTAISPFLASRFAARLFLTPFRYKLPAREREMDKNSTQQLIKIPAINREVVCYIYGDSPRKILLVHGWNGRGTQWQISKRPYWKKDIALSVLMHQDMENLLGK